MDVLIYLIMALLGTTFFVLRLAIALFFGGDGDVDGDLADAGGDGAFNMFSIWCPAESRNEYLFVDPLETMEFCRQFTQHLLLRHEYMPHDFTIYMYR